MNANLPKGLHVIVGLGATGFSCARFLHQMSLPCAVTDTRLTPPFLAALQAEFPDIPVITGRLDAGLLNKAEVIVLSPGLPLKEPLLQEQVKRGIPIIGDIELFARAVNVPVIAITGTNAKSTVTTLVGEMAEAAGYKVKKGGNLGIPALDLLNTEQITELFVLELSSFQLETIETMHPQVATILNITPDHLDRYTNLAEYQAAKQRIYRHCDTAVYNRDDKRTYTTHSKQFRFTLSFPNENEFGIKNNLLMFEDQALLPVNELSANGKHDQANALAALAIGHAFGLPIAPMLNVLKEFKGLPHRCELVRSYKNVKWYDDSKGTNVGATCAAIEGLGSELQGKLVLIAGGVGKSADFTPLCSVIKKYVRHVILIGEAANEMANVLRHSANISFATTMKDAVIQAAHEAIPHDSVLLSPSCASFDMFRNYEHRGEVFKEEVKKLGNK